MKRKVGIILGICFVCLLTGCGPDKSSKKEKADVTPTKTPDLATIQEELAKMEGTGNEDYVACIDMASIANQIKIHKKKVDFPFKPEDFGDDITLAEAESISDYNDKLFRSFLSNEKGRLAKVNYYSAPDGQKKIFSFEISQPAKLSVSIAGITFDSTLDSVIKAFGEPSDKTGDSEEEYSVYYENSKNEYIAFFLQEKKVKTIVFYYLTEEFRTPLVS